MFSGVMRRAENATVNLVGVGFFAIHLAQRVDTDKIARKNATAKVVPLAIISRVRF